MPCAHHHEAGATSATWSLGRLHCPLCGCPELELSVDCDDACRDCLLRCACSSCGFAFGPEQAKLPAHGYEAAREALLRSSCPNCGGDGLATSFVCNLDKECALECSCSSCGHTVAIRT